MKFTFENFLEKQLTDLVVIYPGRFQPAHKNHAKVFNFLLSRFPTAHIYISTSNKVSLPKSPFTFAEKKTMLVAAGIPEKVIIQTTNPYVSQEITKQFNPSTTKLIFAVGGKDMISTATSKPRFSFNPNKNTYFKPLPALKTITSKIIDSLDTFNLHGYVASTPTFNFNLNILGKNIPIKGASDIRSLYINSSDRGKKDIITQLYGTFNEYIYELFNKRII